MVEPEDTWLDNVLGHLQLTAQSTAFMHSATRMYESSCLGMYDESLLLSAGANPLQAVGG